MRYFGVADNARSPGPRTRQYRERGPKMTPTAKSFPPIIDASARTLILGTMPGAESLRANQYYAHPRNTFWKIMARILGFSENATYDEKVAALRENQIALWDVMRSCERIGSLDANIKQQSIKTNDFASLFHNNSKIMTICFNGAKARTEYVNRVLPNLSPRATDINLQRLPSTSPAMARMSFEEKLSLWSKAIRGA